MIRYAYVLLAAIGTAGVVAFFVWMAFGSHVRVERKTVPEPRLTAASTVATATARFKGTGQQVPGEQLGLEGGTCDVWSLADGIALVCHA